MLCITVLGKTLCVIVTLESHPHSDSLHAGNDLYAALCDLFTQIATLVWKQMVT